MKHDGSQQLRRTQRSPAFLLRLVLLAVGVSLVVRIPAVSAALNIDAGDVATAFGALLAVNFIAFVVYHRLGEATLLYRMVALVEAITLLGGIMWLIYRGGRGDGFMWLAYFAAATINSGVTEYRRPLTILYALHPALLALSFVVFRGDWTAAALSVTAGAFGLLVLETRMKTSLRLEQAVADREKALVELGELRVRDERLRIARDLHDGLGADLAAMAWRAERVRAELVESGTGAAGELAGITERATQGIDELRTVVWALRSPSRTWEEIVVYLRQRLGELCAGRVALRVECESGAESLELPGEVATHLIRIVQESVRNALRHAKPTEVLVALAPGPPLRITVEDDGGGLPPEALGRAHGGLVNLGNRACELGGSFTPETTEGRTRLVFQLPHVMPGVAKAG